MFTQCSQSQLGMATVELVCLPLFALQSGSSGLCSLNGQAIVFVYILCTHKHLRLCVYPLPTHVASKHTCIYLYILAHIPLQDLLEMHEFITSTLYLHKTWPSKTSKKKLE